MTLGQNIMKFSIGKKIEMIRYFDESGQAHAATVIEVTPGTVTDIKTLERDKYQAMQIGFGVRKEKHVSKAQKGAWKDLPLFQTVREVRITETSTLGRGDSFSLSDMFAIGDSIVVSGNSKGKGFQGVVKRHGFSGGRRTHGQKHSEREGGSIAGGGRAGGRVAKGMRMPGRMGGNRNTISNLKVLAIDSDKHLLVVKGAVPGRRGTILEITGKEEAK